MNFELTGKLIKKYDEQEFGEKKFKTREFVLDITEDRNGEQTYPNFAKMQLVQAKCDSINAFNEGDMLKVNFNIKGRSYTDKKDGSTKYISNLEAWRVERSAMAAPNTTGNNTGNQTAAPAYNNNGGGNNYSATQNFNPSPETIDDLPF
jgi:hypothetical protein